MQLTFIGTSSGKTSLTRYHSSIVLENDDSVILFDCGDSISRALIKAQISFSSICEIIISHNHADHYTGLPSLLTQMKLNNRSSKLVIRTESNFVKSTWRFLNDCYLFKETLGFELDIIGFKHNQLFESSAKIYITPIKNSHIRKKEHVDDESIVWHSSSFVISYKNSNIIYTSDIGSIDDLNLFDDFTCNIFITETTHINIEDIEEFYHMFPKTKLYLTHIDAESEDQLFNWHNALEEVIRNNITLAYDGMRLKIV